jgi:hypothetical protein
MRFTKSLPEYRRRNHVSGAAKQKTPIAKKAMTWCNFISKAPNARAHRPPPKAGTGSESSVRKTRAPKSESESGGSGGAILLA